MRAREGYRIWHGASHFGAALQVAPNTPMFDGRSMGANTDTDYEPYERIPGLNVGGMVRPARHRFPLSRNP